MKFELQVQNQLKHLLDNATCFVGIDSGPYAVATASKAPIVALLSHMNPNSISQNSVISLFADNNGIMWVGTYKNGISYYHPGMFKFEKSPLFFYQNPRLENKDCNSIFFSLYSYSILPTKTKCK